MNILMISGDSKILSVESEVYARMVMQAYALGRLVVFVRGKKTSRIMLGLDEEYSFVQGFLGSKPIAFLKMFVASQSEEFDVVTTQDPFYLGLLGWFIARGKGVPLQIQVHTDVFSPEFLKFNGYFRILVAKFLLRRAQHVRVVSRRIKDSLLQLNIKAPISIVPVLINVPKPYEIESYDFSKHISGIKKYVLVVARLHRERCVDDAIRLIAKLPKYVGLCIAGDGAEKLALQDLARKLGVENRVVFLGYVKNVFPLYKGADLYLNTTHYDGYGASMVEALAMGCPVLSEDVGVAPEAGAVVAAREEWAGIAASLLANKEEARLQMPLLSKEVYAEELLSSFSFVR